MVHHLSLTLQTKSLKISLSILFYSMQCCRFLMSWISICSPVFSPWASSLNTDIHCSYIKTMSTSNTTCSHLLTLRGGPHKRHRNSHKGMWAWLMEVVYRKPAGKLCVISPKKLPVKKKKSATLIKLCCLWEKGFRVEGYQVFFLILWSPMLLCCCLFILECHFTLSENDLRADKGAF